MNGFARLCMLWKRLIGAQWVHSQFHIHIHAKGVEDMVDEASDCGQCIYVMLK